MKRPHISPALVISLVALSVSLGGTAWAATGGNFILGQANGATTQTGLTANFAGKTLQLANTNTAAGATPLGLVAGTGRPPFTTNSTTKVTNLNADKLDGIDSTGFLAVGGKAADSNLLDGLNSTAFLPAGGQAADSNLLDGIDSTGFINGVGTATAVAIPINPGAQSAFTFGPGWTVAYTCPANTANPGGLAIINGAVVNGSSVGTNLFFEPTVSTPVYDQMPPNSGTANLPATPSGQVWEFRMQTNGYIATLEVATVNRANDCHFQAQALVTKY